MPKLPILHRKFPNIETDAGDSEALSCQNSALTHKMTRPNKKSTQAKQQRSTGGANFSSPPTDIDSDSTAYNSDEASDDSSSDESVGATKMLFSKKLPSHLQPQLVCHSSF